MTTAALVARGCSHGRALQEDDGSWTARGDPMEAAIDSLALQLSGGTAPVDATVSARFAFDPRRRRSSVITADRVLVKGAPDAVLDRCRLDATHRSEAEDALHRLSQRGLRVLAVASRATTRPATMTADEAERDLELLGVFGFEDPPRPEARDALTACRAAGIRVAMITGDSAQTATAIADETGLRPPDGLVLTGAELPADEQVLASLVDRDGVIPEAPVHRVPARAFGGRSRLAVGRCRRELGQDAEPEGDRFRGRGRSGERVHGRG